ncbi:MAG: hypothetical protein PHQ54_00715, partial [Candidatus Omnitrophica bacterium]|nr:hypothetical protein [Candidatus Omnitrophota bacterium]
MKKQVFLKVFIATAITAAIIYSQDGLAATSTGNVGENYGSSAETYKELSPEMTLEQYEGWLLQLKTALLKNKSGEAVSKNFQQVSSTIKWMEYLRKRALEVAKYEAEVSYRPAKSASPNKSVGKDGSISYSGRHAKVLRYIIENYSNLSKKDIQDINQRIASTPGKEWKNGFNVTFDAKIDDELGNTTQMPFTVTLKG